MTVDPQPSQRRWPSLGLSITRKTQGLIALALVVLLGFLYIALRSIVLTSFENLERAEADRSLTLLQDELSRRNDSIERSVLDYAVWDDTYAFMRGGLPRYPQSNFSGVTFASNQLDLVILANRKGDILLYRSIGDLSRIPQDLQRELIDKIMLSSFVVRVNNGQGAMGDPLTGVVVTGQGPVLISAHEILDSDYQGPSTGVLVMGRLIDEEFTRELTSRLRAPVEVYRLDSGNFPTDVAAMVPQLLSGAPTAVQPLSDDQMGGYVLMGDGNGNPVLIFQVLFGRSVRATGQTTITSTLLAFVIAGIVFGISITVLLNRVVLERLTTLIESVRAIGANRSLAQRVSIDGNDELTLLGTTINQTLGLLEEAEIERKQAQKDRYNMWEEVIQARRNFLAAVSHELRTPITPIRGYIDLMLLRAGGPITPDQEEYLSVIRRHIDRLKMIIDNMIEMGTLEAHGLQLRTEPVALPDMLQVVITKLHVMIQNRQVHVSIDTPAELPLVVADPQRLEQILMNLVSNAVKYNRIGGTIRLRVMQPTSDTIEIQVEDSGIGIAPDQIEKLFTPFYRGTDILTDDMGGTGLGLSITRALVLLHGGRIEVQSTPKVGSTFRLILPISGPPNSASSPEAVAIEHTPN